MVAMFVCRGVLFKSVCMELDKPATEAELVEFWTATVCYNTFLGLYPDHGLPDDDLYM